MPKTPDDTRAQSIPISQGRRKSSTEPATAPEPVTASNTSHSTTGAKEGAKEGAEEPTAQTGKGAQGQHGPEYDSRGRKPASDRPNAFNATAWLLEGATGLLEEARHSDLGLSEEFWQHFYAARRESLLTARALIDSLLVQTEREAERRKEKEERKQRRGSIAITPAPESAAKSASETPSSRK